MSQCLKQKEPVSYTNKLIIKTTDTKLNYREYPQLTKNLILDNLDNITMNDERPRKERWRLNISLK